MKMIDKNNINILLILNQYSMLLHRHLTLINQVFILLLLLLHILIIFHHDGEILMEFLVKLNKKFNVYVVIFIH